MENPQKLTEYREKEQQAIHLLNELNNRSIERQKILSLLLNEMLVKDINLSIKKMIDIAELIKQSAENLRNEND